MKSGSRLAVGAERGVAAALRGGFMDAWAGEVQMACDADGGAGTPNGGVKEHFRERIGEAVLDGARQAVGDEVAQLSGVANGDNRGEDKPLAAEARQGRFRGADGVEVADACDIDGVADIAEGEFKGVGVGAFDGEIEDDARVAEVALIDRDDLESGGLPRRAARASSEGCQQHGCDRQEGSGRFGGAWDSVGAFHGHQTTIADARPWPSR